jgi:aminoglycoside phosphotransferase (APT) family kinase protein
MVSQVAAFISRRWCVPLDCVRVDVEPVHGGLESAAARVRISQPQGDGSIPLHFVVKQLPAGFEREADVYELLWRHFDPPPAVRLLGREIASQSTYLYLEEAQPPAVWPWSDTRRAGAVCQALARLHDSQPLPQEVFSWDYEAELARSAQSTLELANTARDTSGRRLWRRIGDLRRVAAALPQMRDRLMTAGTCVVIHGDMHPGNVILRTGDDPDVLLIDWARARIGSPLEDVASWLHSLGCWEPEARRRHDTLMRIYLDARRDRRAFVSDVRVEYWFASASNGLSGAIRYHLAVLSDASRSEAARYDSSRALSAWQRVIRRAAALLGPTQDRRS